MTYTLFMLHEAIEWVRKCAGDCGDDDCEICREKDKVIKVFENVERYLIAKGYEEEI